MTSSRVAQTLEEGSGYLGPFRVCSCLRRDGDHYDALRDCLKAISLNPGHLKAHFRLARCLFELKYVAEALECLDDFKGKFPEQAHSSACDALDRDINAALFSKSDNGGCQHSALWVGFRYNPGWKSFPK